MVISFLKMAERMEAMNAPIEPFDGLVMEGAERLSEYRTDADLALPERIGRRPFAGAKLMVGSSAIIASSRPAHPSWLSTAFGS